MNEKLYQEEVTLPSKGLPYPPSYIPDGRVIISMMGTQEEKILAGGRVSFNVMLSNILDRLIISPKIESSRLLTVDRIFLLLKIRIHTFGPVYPFQMKCPECGGNFKYTANLSELESTEFPDDWAEPFIVSLPLSKEEVKLRLLRASDELDVERFVQKQKTKSSAGMGVGDMSYIPMMAKAIVETSTLNEDSLFAKKIEWVQSLKSPDSLAIQHTLEEQNYGVNLATDIECPLCGAELLDVNIPFNEEFFRPKLSK